MNARFQWLPFERQADGLSLTAPASRNRTPPGHYLLFILNGNNVPSVGSIVQIGAGLVPDDPPPPPPPPPAGIQLSATGRADATYQYLDLTWTGARADSVDVYLNGRFRKIVANRGRTTVTLKFTGAATYRTKVCEKRSSVCSNEASVSFAGVPTTPIQLSATGRADGTYQYLDLTWTGARSDSVDVYMNDRFRKIVPNRGGTTLRTAFTGTTTYRTKVCEKRTSICSNIATVQSSAVTAAANVAP
jgi:hypothetical protein